MTIDIVNPLKIETPVEGGTETDPFPTEVDPSEDYLGAKGIVFDSVSGNRIEGVSGIQWFRDVDNPVSGWTLTDLARRLYGIDVASGVPENDAMLTYSSASGWWYPRSPQTIPSASPGFTWGKSGVVPAGTYLDNDSVPSNIVGRAVPVSSSFLTNVFVAIEIATTCSFDIQRRNIDGTFTTIATVTLTASRKNVFNFAAVSVSYNDELCVRVSPTSANNPKNPVIGVIIRGATA